MKSEENMRSCKSTRALLLLLQLLLLAVKRFAVSIVVADVGVIDGRNQACKLCQMRIVVNALLLQLLL